MIFFVGRVAVWVIDGATNIDDVRTLNQKVKGYRACRQGSMWAKVFRIAILESSAGTPKSFGSDLQLVPGM